MCDVRDQHSSKPSYKIAPHPRSQQGAFILCPWYLLFNFGIPGSSQPRRNWHDLELDRWLTRMVSRPAIAYCCVQIAYEITSLEESFLFCFVISSLHFAHCRMFWVSFELSTACWASVKTNRFWRRLATLWWLLITLNRNCERNITLELGWFSLLDISSKGGCSIDRRLYNVMSSIGLIWAISANTASRLEFAGYFLTISEFSDQTLPNNAHGMHPHSWRRL